MCESSQQIKLLEAEFEAMHTQVCEIFSVVWKGKNKFTVTCIFQNTVEFKNWLIQHHRYYDMGVE